MSPVPTLGWGSPRLQGCRTIFTEISLMLWGGEEKTQTLQESARCSASTGCQLLALLVSLELLRGKRGQLGSLSRDEANPLTSRAERRWIFFSGPEVSAASGVCLPFACQAWCFTLVPQSQAGGTDLPLASLLPAGLGPRAGSLQRGEEYLSDYSSSPASGCLLQL